MISDVVGVKLGRMGFADFGDWDNFDKLISYVNQNGFELVQISFDNPHYFPEKFDKENRQSIRGKFKSQGIGLGFHGPTDISLLSRHEKIRTAGITRMIEFIDLAIELGGDYFILHPGRLGFYSLSSKKIFFMENRYPERISSLFMDSIRRLLETASGRIKICIENTHTISAPYLEMIGKLVSNEGLGLVWDVGHMEQLNENKKLMLIKFFQDNLRNIQLAHLHDFRDSANHKGLGTGSMNLSAYLKIFRALSLDVVLEIFPESELLKSLEHIRKLEFDVAQKAQE